MNKFSFKPSVRGLSSRRGKNWCFVFTKNSFKNRMLKFSIKAPDSWSVSLDEVNTKFSGFASFLYAVVPENPLIHPVNELSVFPV